MFLVCKSHVYCNQDAQGLRCSCLDYVMSTTKGTRVLPGRIDGRFSVN